MRRTLIVGWDGASLRIILQLVRQGRLPTFAGLMQQGVLARTTSTVPVHSPPAWCTILTGQNPGEHGVYDFLYREGRGYSTRPHSSRAISGRTFWDVLSEQGERVILVNVPFSYPPYPVKGIMVSGFPCPTNGLVTYPDDLGKTLKQRHPDYRIDVATVRPNYAGMDEKMFQEEIFSIADSRLTLTRELVNTTEWSLFMVVFTCLDRLQHVFWRHYDRAHPLHDPRKEDLFGETIPKFYCRLDSALKDIANGLDEKDVVIVCSDHGFEPTRKYVGINNFLEEKGFVRMRQAAKVGWSKMNVEKLMHDLGIGELKKRIPHLLKDRVPGEVDFSKTKAYALSYGQIYLNVRGRDASGIVEPSSVFELRRELATYLKELEDPESHEAITERVYLKEEVYSGKLLEKAPELVVILKEGYKPTMWNSSGVIVEPVGDLESEGTVESGGHHGLTSQESFMMISGGRIRKGGQITGMTIEDIAPTILRLYEVPQPTWMKGRVPSDLFDE